MEQWTDTRAFAWKAFLKNGDSLVIAQHEFRREFGIHRNHAVLSAHAIKTWILNFEAAGSTLNTKEGRVKEARSQGNSCGDASKSNG
jgi:sugar/nucleoside kinase (ribokinase family)